MRRVWYETVCIGTSVDDPPCLNDTDEHGDVRNFINEKKKKKVKNNISIFLFVIINKLPL